MRLPRYLLLAAALVAARASGQEATESFGETIDVEVVEVEVVATEDVGFFGFGYGDPVADLAASEIEVRVGGEAREIVAFERVAAPFVAAEHAGEGDSARTFAPAAIPVDASRVFLAFDINSIPVPHLHRALRAAEHAVAAAPAGTAWSVAVVGYDPRVLQPLTFDRERVLAALAGLGELRAGHGVAALPFYPTAGREPLVRDELGWGESAATAPRLGIGPATSGGVAALLAEAERRTQRLAEQATARAMVELFRSHATLPGTKTCLLFYGDGLQDSFYPAETRHVPFAALDDSARRGSMWGEVARHANAARFTVYAADVYGLVVSGARVDESQPHSTGSFFRNTGGRVLAERTGGLHFVSNNLGRPITRALRELDGRYRLAYLAAPDDANDAVRHVEVRTRREGVRLRYGREAFSLDRRTLLVEQLSTSAGFEKRGGSLPLELTLSDNGRRATISLPVDRIGASADAAGRLHAALEVFVAAYDRSGAVRYLESREQRFPMAAGAAILRGVIELPSCAGCTTIAIGVHDRAADAIGLASLTLRAPGAAPRPRSTPPSAVGATLRAGESFARHEARSHPARGGSRASP